MGFRKSDLDPYSPLRLQLKQEMGSIVTSLIQNYKDSHEDRLQEAWDYVQAQVRRRWQGWGGVRVLAQCV